MTNTLLAVVLVGFIIGSCEGTEVNNDFNSTDFWIEHHTNSWDSLSIKQNLIGTWKWVYSYCCGEGALSGTRTDIENLKVRFSESRIELIVNNQIVQISNWTLYMKDGDLYGLDVHPLILQLHGRILFSGNKVLFNNFYIDGADSYFERTASIK